MSESDREGGDPVEDGDEGALSSGSSSPSLVMDLDVDDTNPTGDTTEERPASATPSGSKKYQDWVVCCVQGCPNKSQDMVDWRAEMCETHAGKTKSTCVCRSKQPFCMYGLNRVDPDHCTLLYELCLEDSTLKKIRNSDWTTTVSWKQRVCSQHFHPSMNGEKFAFPILALNKSRARIRLIARKYGYEHLLPADFDTMSLDRNETLPFFTLARGRTARRSTEKEDCHVGTIPPPREPLGVPNGEELRHLIYSTDDEELEKYAATLPADETKKVKRTNKVKEKRSKENKPRTPGELKRMAEYLKSKGCSVFSHSDFGNFLAKSVRCYVKGCAQSRGRVSKNRFLLASLPVDVELAIHCVCSASTDLGHQNTLISRLIQNSGLYSKTRLLARTAKSIDEVKVSMQLDREVVEASSALFCDRHFTLPKEDEEEEPYMVDGVEATPPILVNHLPEQKLDESNPRTYQQLHHRSVILRQLGLENSKIIPYADYGKDEQAVVNEHNWQQKSLSCAISGCMASKNFWPERFRMVPVPDNWNQFFRWQHILWQNRCMGEKDALSGFGFLCEQHFPDLEPLNGSTARIVRVDYDKCVPSVFEKSKHTISFMSKPAAACVVRSCSYSAPQKAAADSVKMIPFPAIGKKRTQWIYRIEIADNERDPLPIHGQLWICEHHFSMTCPGYPSINLMPKSYSQDVTFGKLQKNKCAKSDAQPVINPYQIQPSLGGKRRCCVETGAIVTKLARVGEKASLLHGLIGNLYQVHGETCPISWEWDDKKDDERMYGSLGGMDSYSLASVVSGFQSVLHDTRAEIDRLSDKLDGVVKPAAAANLADALAGMFPDQSTKKTNKSSPAPTASSDGSAVNSMETPAATADG